VDNWETLGKKDQRDNWDSLGKKAPPVVDNLDGLDLEIKTSKNDIQKLK